MGLILAAPVRRTKHVIRPRPFLNLVYKLVHNLAYGQLSQQNLRLSYHPIVMAPRRQAAPEGSIPPPSRQPSPGVEEIDEVCSYCQ